ncbi:redox-sensitive transcriptional activator SoxR [Actomonas aquatica]|uniref:Redox-sensitive transcriptional activator SoxR n=1 Tax=Actomonas aquatica TaxID=2866162 RepID=A0ABZ1C2K6_9BACT|nr:redox-sensitive transcriptional activator SoxR [Opitutus sp. WL0086]WRQ85948.1 redox-sensitive transcriptional activator SoxR [Opitutus sp. WL0086]
MPDAKDREDLLTVGEIARRSGLAVSAIHFYEAKGLIHGMRDWRNQRRFSRRELRILALIKVAQRLGFTLEEIKDTFRDLPQKRVPSKSDWRKISQAWKEALQAKIELATTMRDQLNLCIGCGCLSLKDCPLRNPEDALSAQGPGAHLI